MVESLRSCTKEVLGWIVDDFFLGPKRTELLSCLEEFLMVCRKWKVTLSPRKTRIGYAYERAVGHLLSQGRIQIDSDNLRPIKECAGTFKNVTELKSFLGSLVFCKDHIANFALIAQPLNSMTGKGKFDPRVFTNPDSPQRAAVRALQKAALDQYPLYVPNYRWPLHLDTDASKAGVSWVLYQVHPDEVVPDIDWHTIPPEKKLVLRLGSKCYSKLMTSMPIYYQEAWAIVVGLSCNRYTLLSSPFEVAVHCDQVSLKWMKHSSKGVIASWLVWFLGGICFRIVYLKGIRNLIADPFSRVPMISPNRIAFAGLSVALQTLLDVAPEVLLSQVWFHCYADMPALVKRLRAAQPRGAKPLVLSSPANAIFPKVDVAILLPRPELSPIRAAALFRSSLRFAVLVPCDLVDYICKADSAEEVDEVILSQLEGVRKIVFMTAGFCWLLRGFPGTHEVFTASEESTSTVDTKKWAAEQIEEIDEYKSEYGDRLASTDDGLHFVVTTGEPARVVVPRGRRHALTQEVHETLKHAASRRTTNKLAARYTWPGMAKFVKEQLLRCQVCSVVHNKIVHAHKSYSPFTFDAPYRFYAIDWYKMPRATDGSTQIFAAVDMASRQPILEPQRDRSAESAARSILKRIIYARGTPVLIWSDTDRSFMGRLCTLLLKTLGIRHILTNNYPQGNSMVESMMIFLGEWARCLPRGRRMSWHLELPALEFAIASTQNSSTSISPFRFERGVDPLLPCDAALIQVPDNPAELLLKDTAGAFAKLGDSIAAFQALARKHVHMSAVARSEQANARGRMLPPLRLGDSVVIYVPSKGEPGWRPKHCIQWRSGFIVEKEGRTWYRAQEQGTRRLFHRHISMLPRDYSRDCLHELSVSELVERIFRLPKVVFPLPDEPVRVSGRDNDVHHQDSPAPVRSVLPATVSFQHYSVGTAAPHDMLLARDDDASTILWVAQVLALDDESVRVHYWGTRQRGAKAKFKPVFIEKGLTVVGKRALAGGNTPFEPWTGQLPDDRDIIFFKICLKNGAIPLEARRAMRDLGFKHAVL